MRVLGWIVAGGMSVGTAVLAAQQTQPSEQAEKDRLAKLSGEVMARMAAQLHPCPVGFRAEVDPKLTLREVEGGAKDADATMVRLEIMASDAVDPKKAIVSANVTAHGVSRRGQLMLVDDGSDESRTQAFSLNWVAASGLIESDLRVTQVPFVRWIELNRIAYKDGSVWHAAEGTVCKAELSKFHPI